MRKILILILLFNLSLGFAQEGHLSLKHFSVPLARQDYLFNDMAIDKQGRLLLAYRRGLLQFDGRSWEEISISSSPLRFLSIGSDLFLLTKRGISIVNQDKNLQNTVEPLYNNDQSITGSDLVKYHNMFYYLAGSKIISLFPSSFKTDTVFESNRGFNDIFTYQDKLYAFEGNYLLEFYHGSWVDLNFYAPKNTDFVFSCQTDAYVFFAYDNGDFFAFDGEDYSVFSEELNEYLKENYPVSGKILGNKIVIATLNGGAVIVDIESKKIINTIQYFNGLPSDEVNALTMDKFNGIWLAHPSGVSRASLDIPIKEFHHYPGLKGIPESVLHHNDTLFVGTNEGLFYLAIITDYESFQKVMKERVRIEVTEKEEETNDDRSLLNEIFSSDSNKDGEENFIKEELDRYKKIYRSEGIRFRKLRNKLAEKEEQLRDSLSQINNPKDESSTIQKKIGSSKQYRYKTVTRLVDVSRLKSFKYEYIPIKSVKRKVTDLIETPQGIIAITTSGVFKINDTTSVKLSDYRFIEKAYYDVDHHTLWLGGDFGLYSLDLESEDDQVKSRFPEPIFDIAIHNNKMALAGENKIFLFNLTNEKLSDLTSYTINNDFSDRMMVYFENENLKILKLDGLYQLDPKTNQIIKEKSYKGNLKYFLKDSRHGIWLTNQKGQWNVQNAKVSPADLQWMKILSYIKYIHHSDSSIYFIANNRVVELQAGKKELNKTPLSFISAVYRQDNKLSDLKNLELHYDNNSLRVSVSTIDYLFQDGVSYQYYLKGLMDDWSPWSKGGEIGFPYLPTGEYVLQIKSKSGFSDDISSIDFSFEVLPPYWRTWWFYSLEIAFFSTLILISLRMNRSSKNTYLTNTITFLTLILILEFIATILENNLEGYVDDSPVYTFMINVALALAITPLGKAMNKLLVIMNTQKIKLITHEMRSKQLEKKKDEQNKN